MLKNRERLASPELSEVDKPRQQKIGTSLKITLHTHKIKKSRARLERSYLLQILDTLYQMIQQKELKFEYYRAIKAFYTFTLAFDY